VSWVCGVLMAFLVYFCGLFKASERFANSDRSIIKDEGIYSIVFGGYCSNVRSSLKGRIEALEQSCGVRCST
jgi:hypothetical protein